MSTACYFKADACSTLKENTVETDNNNNNSEGIITGMIIIIIIIIIIGMQL